MKMREIAEGIYEVILHDKEKEVGEMRVHIVRENRGREVLWWIPDLEVRRV